MRATASSRQATLTPIVPKLAPPSPTLCGDYDHLVVLSRFKLWLFTFFLTLADLFTQPQRIGRPDGESPIAKTVLFGECSLICVCINVPAKGVCRFVDAFSLAIILID